MQICKRHGWVPDYPLQLGQAHTCNLRKESIGHIYTFYKGKNRDTSNYQANILIPVSNKRGHPLRKKWRYYVWNNGTTDNKISDIIKNNSCQTILFSFLWSCTISR